MQAFWRTKVQTESRSAPERPSLQLSLPSATPVSPIGAIAYNTTCIPRHHVARFRHFSLLNAVGDRRIASSCSLVSSNVIRTRSSSVLLDLKYIASTCSTTSQQGSIH